MAVKRDRCNPWDGLRPITGRHSLFNPINGGFNLKTICAQIEFSLWDLDTAFVIYILDLISDLLPFMARFESPEDIDVSGWFLSTMRFKFQKRIASCR
ncbi:hypothetical protein ACS0TY_034514 [Phlomoides rotata]